MIMMIEINLPLSQSVYQSLLQNGNSQIGLSIVPRHYILVFCCD